MPKYIIRLDDAAEKRNIKNWDRVEYLLDCYNVKPLVAVIPNSQDKDFEPYDQDPVFWNRVKEWENKGWTIALHGFNHVFSSNNGGINPVNSYSEFAGLPLFDQCKKIKNAMEIFNNNGIEPTVFVAPAHTFDENTLEALRTQTSIRTISDTPASKAYIKDGFLFVPQQSGKVRWLPFEVVTFCYHPNTMKQEDFERLEEFIKKHRFSDFSRITSSKKLSLIDAILMRIYYRRHAK